MCPLCEEYARCPQYAAIVAWTYKWKESTKEIISLHIIHEFLRRRNHRSITNFSSMFYYEMTGKQEKKKERMIQRQRNEENCIDGALIGILRMTFKLALKTWELLGIKMLSNVLLKPILLRGTMQNSWANLDHHVQRVTDEINIIIMQSTKYNAIPRYGRLSFR